MTVEKFTREALKDWLTIAAILIGGSWTFWTFVYEQRLKPLSETSYIRPTVTLELAAHNYSSGPINALPVLIRIRLENVSKRRVRILAGQIDLHGDKLLPSPESDFTPESVAATLNYRDKAVRSRFWNKRDGQLVFTSSAFRLWVFEPGEQQEFTRLTWVPQNLFHQLEANLYVKATAEMGALCLVSTVNEKFETDVIPGRRADGKCTAVAADSPDAKTLMKDVLQFDTTSYVVLPTSASERTP